MKSNQSGESGRWIKEKAGLLHRLIRYWSERAARVFYCRVRARTRNGICHTLLGWLSLDSYPCIQRREEHDSMYTFETPLGRAGTDQLYGMEESINSHIERMFFACARRSVLEHGVGRTTSTAGGADSQVRLHAQRRECDAAITSHAGKALEVAMQLIYSFGTDRIWGREYPGVSEKQIKKDISKGHDLRQLYSRIISEMHDRDMKSGFEDAYQSALNPGLVDVLIDGELSWSEFATIEDMPFREHAIRHIADGMEITRHHVSRGELLFPPQSTSEFGKMQVNNFVQFLDKADASYYERDIPDKEGKTKRRNMRMADYSARDHEYGRPYAVAGVMFFARLAKEIVKLGENQSIWHPDFALRWWNRRQYIVGTLLNNHAKQNFPVQVEFPTMITPEEALDRFTLKQWNPAARIRRGYEYLRYKREWNSKN